MLTKRSTLRLKKQLGPSPKVFSMEPFKIRLKGTHFSGKEFETNKRCFKDFLTKFENCAALIPSATSKLYFLGVP